MVIVFIQWSSTPIITPLTSHGERSQISSERRRKMRIITMDEETSYFSFTTHKTNELIRELKNVVKRVIYVIMPNNNTIEITRGRGV